MLGEEPHENWSAGKKWITDDWYPQDNLRGAILTDPDSTYYRNVWAELNWLIGPEVRRMYVARDSDHPRHKRPLTRWLINDWITAGKMHGLSPQELDVSVNQIRTRLRQDPKGWERHPEHVKRYRRERELALAA